MKRPAGLICVISGWLLCFAMPAFAANGGISIGSVSSDIAPSEKIGKLKQGFICAPKGSLKFGQLRPPDNTRLPSRIAALNAEHGQRVEVADPRFASTQQAAPYVLVGKIDAIALDLCVPGANIGIGSRRSKGSGSLVVTWQLWRQADRTLEASKVVTVPFDVKGVDPRQSSEEMEDHLARSAMLFLEAHAGVGAK